jgi:hypothetical protein
MPNSDEPTSVVEDLDPEPPARHGGRQAWEPVLGVVLIALVLGFAGWQWLRQSQQQSSYAAGIEAAQRFDWEAAQAYFRSASGYSDADKQVQEIDGKIALRDDQYDTAIAALNAGNWAACLKSIQQVTDVQPGYKDSTRIEQRASEQVYRDAMSGTIALRPDANPPGLYLYGPDGWTWLPQSDGYSQVRGESEDGWIAYDTPGDDLDARSSPTPEAGAPGASPLAGRRYVAVQLSNLSNLKPLNLDPAQYYLQPVGRQGVWATGYSSGLSYDPLPVRFTRYLNIENGSPIAYQAYDSVVTGTINIPPSNRNTSAVMDLDPGSNRYLLADWVRAYPGGLVGPDTATNLYLASTSGSKQLLYSLSSSSFISARFSPDGRHALLATYTPLSSGGEMQSIILLDLESVAAPRLLSSGVAQVDKYPFSDPQDRSWLTAAFIDDGPYAGKIVLSAYDGNQNRLEVIDPDKEQALLVDLQVPSDKRIIWTLHPGNDRMSLLSGQEVVPDGYGLVEVPLWFVSLSPGGQSTVTRLRTLVNDYVQYARLAGDNLAYSTYELGQNGRDIRSVFSFPISRFGVTGENAWTMFTQEESAGGSDDIFSFGDYSLGPSLLAYVSDGDLHARLYDGSVDVVLEHHVTYLYDTYLHGVSDARLR